MENSETPVQRGNQSSRDVKIVGIEQNIVRSAIARNPFFTFASLKRYLPRLTSIREFITSENYLGGLAITFKGNLADLEENRSTKLAACEGLLGQIESEIRKEINGLDRIEAPYRFTSVGFYLKPLSNNPITLHRSS